MTKDNEQYGCADYEADKQALKNAGLTPDEYEARIKEMCKRNGF